MEIDEKKSAYRIDGAPAPDRKGMAYSVEGIRMPMPSSVDDEANIDDFCPYWLVLDDLVPKNERSKQDE